MDIFQRWTTMLVKYNLPITKSLFYLIWVEHYFIKPGKKKPADIFKRS